MTRSIHVKKSISLILILCMALTVLAPLGCSASHGNGSEVCRAFLEYICEGSYGAAYDLLSPSVKNTTGSETKAGDPMISAKEFSDKYTQIFNAVGLSDISYTIGNISDASITSSIDFTMTYHTKALGEMTNNYTINARFENGKWGIVWTPALIFPTMQWGDKLLIGINYPKRGEIFDAEGELLVKNLAPVTIFCVPNRIPADKKDQVIQALMAIPQIRVNGEDAADFQKRIREAVYSKNSSAVIAKLYPDQMDSALEERFLSITGVGVDNSASLTSTRFRQYPYGRSACHLLGFAAVMWKEDWRRIDMINRRNAAITDIVNITLGVTDPTNNHVFEVEDDSNSVYQKDSWLGYAGIEKQYEEQLRGEKGGFAYIQGIDGSNRQTLYNIPAKDGQDIRLTLDIRLQQRVEEVVKTIVYDEGISGTVLIMNPRTGAIQAMYSFPDYDVEAFSRGTVGTDAFMALDKDPQTPMLNRAIQGLYAPGSTFKPMTAIAALETHTLTTETIFPYAEDIHNGVYKTSSGYKDAWNVKKSEYAYTGIDEITRTGTSRRHTPMNMESSIIDSDNIFFAWSALMMGWDKYKDFLSFIGMGEYVPFDLPTQRSQVKNAESSETYSLLAMTGYGQGELLVTPLQMACYIASFRNDGKAPVPYVVDSIWQAEGNDYSETYKHESSKVWKTMCSSKNADDLTQMMIGVCREDHGGTARTLGVRSYVIAGKTGTAEIGNKTDAKTQADKELAWFIGFRETNRDGSDVAPENERLVLVMLELDMSNLPEEYAQMKFLIGRALLKDDDLTKPGTVETCISGGSGSTTNAN